MDDTRYVVPSQQPSITLSKCGYQCQWFPNQMGYFQQHFGNHLSPASNLLAATFNISATYWLTPIRPNQQHTLCVLWKGKVYINCAVMFGLASSTGVFSAIADMLLAIYWAAQFGVVTKWVDDFFAIWLPNQTFVSPQASLHLTSSVHANLSWIKFLPHNMPN